MDTDVTDPGATFGNLLRRYRLAAGLSQEALAERARISTQGIGALERGDRRVPQRETLALLTDALALAPEQRRTFEAAAVRRSVPRRSKAAVAAGVRPSSPRSNLPFLLTGLVGRETEVGEIAKFVREYRLVTLTGSAGIGKTRTALNVAGAFADGPDADVCLVELAPIGDATLVAATMAAALGLQDVPNQTQLETILSHVRGKMLLLVLDNCEHVIAEAARVVDALLRSCPDLHVLATSREPLRVAGERVYRLSPLAVPSPDVLGGLGGAEAAGFAALALFADRARLVDRHFVLGDENAPLVATICARLDGIPLAIELAAARVTALSLPALAETLERRFLSLGGGDRTALARQRTLRAAVDWSYELLVHPEGRTFENFSIFAGGCTLEAACAVCGGDGDDQLAVFDVLMSLVEKSLIVADFEGPAPRYRMLETFRQYAREKLVARGALDEVCARHAGAYLQIAEQVDEASRRGPDREWHATVRSEFDNWRAALEWALGAQRDISLGQRLAASLKPAWNSFATSEGERWIGLARAGVDEETPPDIAARLDWVHATLWDQLGRFGDALDAAQRAAARYRLLGDRIGIARAQGEAASALIRFGRPTEAEPLLREALDVARAHGRNAFAAKILNHIVDAQALLGEFAAARTASDEALAIYRSLGKGRSVVVTTTTRAELEFRAGDAEAAVRLGEESLRSCNGLEDRDSIECVVHANVAAYLVALGRYGEARAHAREALGLSHRFGFALRETWALQHLAAIAALRPPPGADATSDAVRAAQLIGFVEQRYAELGALLEPTDKQEYDRVTAALEATLGADVLDAARSDGAAMSEGQAIEAALLV